MTSRNFKSFFAISLSPALTTLQHVFAIITVIFALAGAFLMVPEEILKIYILFKFSEQLNHVSTEARFSGEASTH